MQGLAKLSPRRLFGRYRHWLIPFAKLGLGQAATTGLNALFMLTILRVASKPDFAVYSLFNNMHNTMTGLSDLGLSGAIIAVGARHRGDEVYGVVAMVRRFRMLLFAIGVCISAGLLGQMIRQDQIGLSLGILCFSIALCSAWWAIAITVQSSLLNLFEKFGALSLVSPIIAATRLVSLAGGWIVGFGVAFLLAIGGISQVVGYVFIKTRDRGVGKAELTKEQRATIRKEIVSYTRPLILSSILFYAQPTIVLWVLNYLGTSREVADFSAVGSLARVLSVVSTATTGTVMSRFSKIESHAQLVRLFKKFTVMQVIIVVTVVLSGLLFPALWLSLLGRRYSGLNVEIIHFFVGWGLTYLAGFFFSVLAARSRTAYQAHVLIASLALQAVYGIVAGVSNAREAFIMNNVYLAAFALGQGLLVYALLFRARPSKEEPRPI